ncbi:DUF2306 domain-containing protein [Streptosporangium sp. NPDC051023]|uniref:DUF2306 domain-containing protein n=1 Tax=Streptosporangium sp. NPDC051023 TaxID=3155410 RepID=UPI00344EE6E2
MTQKSDGAGTLVSGPEEQEDGEGSVMSRARRPWWRSPWVYGLAALVVFNLIYALPRYLSFDPTQSRTRIDPTFPLHYPVVVLHVVAGNLALVTVFLQLLPWIRRRHPAFHRMTGRVYVFGGVIPTALLSLVLLPYSTAPMGKLGLATMAILWLATALTGYRMARRRRYMEHRRWMIYSFALAMGTSWGRVISQFAIPGKGIDVAVFFDISSWMGWVVSLVAAYWWLERTSPRRRAVKTTVPS